MGPPLSSLPISGIYEVGRVTAGLQTASWSPQESAPLGTMDWLFQAWTRWGPIGGFQEAQLRTGGHWPSPPGPLFWAPMALALQLWGPLGTLTVCWSRHGWQEYSKLENWQYLPGPQSSSMMHSWEGGREGGRQGGKERREQLHQ